MPRVDELAGFHSHEAEVTTVLFLARPVAAVIEVQVLLLGVLGNIVVVVDAVAVLFVCANLHCRLESDAGELVIVVVFDDPFKSTLSEAKL